MVKKKTERLIPQSDQPKKQISRKGNCTQKLETRRSLYRKKRS